MPLADVADGGAAAEPLADEGAAAEPLAEVSLGKAATGIAPAAGKEGGCQARDGLWKTAQCKSTAWARCQNGREGLGGARKGKDFFLGRPIAVDLHGDDPAGLLQASSSFKCYGAHVSVM